MKRKGHLGVSQSNRFSKGSLAEGGGGSGSPQNQQKKKEMNEDDVITNAEAQIMRLKQSQSEQTGEGKSEDSVRNFNIECVELGFYMGRILY